MPSTNVPNEPSLVTATTVIGGVDAVSIVESVDRQDRTVELRFHGDAGGVVIRGSFQAVYALVLDADRQLGTIAGGRS